MDPRSTEGLREQYFADVAAAQGPGRLACRPHGGPQRARPILHSGDDGAHISAELLPLEAVATLQPPSARHFQARR